MENASDHEATADRAWNLLPNQLLKVASAILLVEATVLLGFSVLQFNPLPLQQVALHAALVALCSSVLLYFWLFRPLDEKLLATMMELESSRARTEQQSRMDSLTGILNRRTFFEQFERDWDRASRYKTPIACIMLDLDLFKHLNDTHGHLVGDAALRKLAQLLRTMCRSSDSLCRYGGEEFCILLPETTEQEAAEFAERLRKAIIGQPIRSNGVEIFTTSSFGVAQRDAQMNVPDNLVELADRALMESKREGRNRVTRGSTLAETHQVLIDH